MKTAKCHITEQELPLERLVHATNIKKGVFDLIKNDKPDFSESSYISSDELIKYRKKYLSDILREEKGDLSHLEEEVLKSITENELLSSNIEPEIEKKLSFGDKLADRIAEFGGSWVFIILFFSFLLLWMFVNVYILSTKPFDPYPFILLNLILSCLAAIQAPIIMMSQNRQEEKDRQRSEHDYKVNLKAELEIRLLHEKIDHLLLQQNQRLLEIQEIQVDLMEDIITRLNTLQAPPDTPHES
jgi:uncharacterized membrane protein